MQKGFFKRIETVLNDLSAKLDRLLGNGVMDKILVDINRHQVGSIGLCDLMNEEAMDEPTRKEYLRNAEEVWRNPVFKKEITMLIRKQENFIACWAEDEKQVLVGRGTINGVSLIEERLRELHSEYEATKPVTESFDKHSVI